MLSIQVLIDQEIKKQNDGERKDYKQTSWHASSLGNCLTGAYLARLGNKPDQEFDARTLRVFDVGRKTEDWIIDLVSKQKDVLQFKTQERIEWPEYNLTGRYDLWTKEEKELIWEFKSKHSRAFWYMEKKGEGAPIHNQMQLWSYLKVKNIQEGRLVYISKDDLAILEYPVYLNDKNLEKRVLEELQILNEAWSLKIPPQPILDEKDWRFKYCSFHKQCKKLSVNI